MESQCRSNIGFFVKPDQRIRKPGLAFGVAGLVVAVLLLWFGLARRNRTETPAVQPAEAQTLPPTEVAATPAVAPEEKPTVARPEGELPPVVPISLAGVFVSPENDQWSNPTFLCLPRGTQHFGGVEFWLEGMIELQSKSSSDERKGYREKIIVPLLQTNVTQTGMEFAERGSNVAAVHLLGGTRYPGEGETTVADLVWHYKDGGASRTPIQFENHVREWVRNPYETPQYLPYAFSKAVWRGPLTTQPGRMIRLYRFSYANPQPAKVVRELEFVSAMKSPSLFLVGLTLDPLKPGERPDDSPNVEPTDPNPPNVLEVFVQNADGQPVSGAKVGLHIQYRAGKQIGRA